MHTKKNVSYWKFQKGNNKKGYAISLYLSPSQTSYEFDFFISNMEKFVVDIYS